MDTAGDENGQLSGVWGLVGDVYGAGGFVYINNGSDPSEWTTVNWNTFGGSDLAFKANFGVTQPTITATEGIASSGPVAVFADAGYPNNSPSDFTSSIDWGDGTTTAGIVSGGNGTFTVSGAHTYAEEGSFTLSATLTDDAPGTAQATLTSTVVVADAALTASGRAVSATEGASFTGVVASFTDANPGASAADFSATIDWGDGTVTTGSVVANGSGGFDVTGTNAYAEEGSYTIGVTIADVGGSTASANSTATREVVGAGLATTVLPVSSAATAGPATSASGKLNGATTPKTPNGRITETFSSAAFATASGMSKPASAWLA